MERVAACEKGRLNSLDMWFVRRVGVARATTFLCAIGLATAALAGAHPWVGSVGLASALFSAVVTVPLRGRRGTTAPVAHSLMLAAILLIGFFAGFLGGSVRVLDLTGGEASAYVGDRVRGTFVVTGPVRANSGWQSANARVLDAEVHVHMSGGAPASPALPEGETLFLEVAPSAGGEGTAAVALREGAIVACSGILREPKGPSTSGFDQQSYLGRQGIEVVLRVAAGDLVVEGSRGGFCGWFDRIRSHAREDLHRGPEPRLDAVLQGVVMGETSDIDKTWMEAFRRAGTAHMLSVSGLHVGSLAAILLALARLIGLSRGVGFVLAMLAASSMIPFTGASPPVLRAATMIVIVLVGRWVGRGRDQWQVLALAAVAVLALNPFALMDVGFQLSFGAFVGMMALAKRVEKRLRVLPPGLAASLAVSVAASLGTAPVSLAVFGQTSVVGAMANLLVIPILSIITGLGIASVLLGYIWSGLSAGLDTVAAPATAWTVQVSRLFGAAPVLETGDLGRASAAVGMALLAVPPALALAGRLPRPPLGMPLPFFRRTMRRLRARSPRSVSLRVGSAVAVLGCALLVGAAAYAPLAHAGHMVVWVFTGERWPEGVEVRVLDVGQGNAVLVRTPARHALLFDGGPMGCDLESQLTALGVRRLDAVVISHPHADHFAGLLECAEELEVGLLVEPTKVTNGSTQPVRDAGIGSQEGLDYLGLRRMLLEDGARHLVAVTGSSFEVDGVRVDLYAPRRPLTMAEGADPWQGRAGPPDGEELNGSSLVAVVHYGQTEVLIPGDAEAQVLAGYDLPPVDVVVVPHHGSKGAVTDGLLARLGVKSAAVSVGEENSFGHPAEVTLEVLSRAGVGVVRTDRSGWVSYTTDGEEIILRTER